MDGNFSATNILRTYDHGMCYNTHVIATNVPKQADRRQLNSARKIFVIHKQGFIKDHHYFGFGFMAKCDQLMMRYGLIMHFNLQLCLA